MNCCVGCEEYFQTDNPYKVLDVEMIATENEIKKAYRQKCLKVHPDKVSQDRKKMATGQFQVLSEVAGNLMNKEKRADCDEFIIKNDAEIVDTLLKSCEKYFGTQNVYKVFDVERNANKSEIEKAYKKISRQWDPEHVQESQKVMAEKKSKLLFKIYQTLMDPDKRTLYNQRLTEDTNRNPNDNEKTGINFPFEYLFSFLFSFSTFIIIAVVVLVLVIIIILIIKYFNGNHNNNGNHENQQKKKKEKRGKNSN